MEIHILDFIRAFPDTKEASVLRDKKEYIWIQRLRTQAPLGINTMDKMPRVPRDYRLAFRSDRFYLPSATKTAPTVRQ